MRLWYVDAANCTRYVVKSVNENEMTVIDGDGYEDVMEFRGLQVGWSFSNKDREFIELTSKRAIATA